LGGAARPALERLEERRLLAALSLQSATVKPDGRLVELVFTGPATDGVGVPDIASGSWQSDGLTTNLGTQLEPLGTVVTTSGSTLVWTVTYLVSAPAQVITFGTPVVTVSAAERLVSDDHGNWTAPIGGAVTENLSMVGPDGFSTQDFTRGVGGVTLYVSTTYGNDARTFAQAQNPATPYLTVAKAFKALKDNGQDGRGAAVRMLRGDVFVGGLMLGIGGQDRSHPLVLEDYWYNYGDGKVDPKTRPVIQADWSQGVYSGLSMYRGGQTAGAGVGQDYVVIRRLAFKAVKRFTSTQRGTGISLLGGGRGWLIDDVDVSNFSTNLNIQGYYAQFQDVTLLRSIAYDAYVAQAGNGFSQGAYFQNVDSPLISQSTFDRNGRTNTNMIDRDIFSHNLYVHENNGPATIWGNVIRNGGSHGVHLRSGGIVAYNYLGRNAIAVEMSAVGGVLTHNVVEAGQDISATEPRGFGLVASTKYGSSLVSVVEQNIVVNTTAGASKPLFLWQVGNTTIEHAVFRNNTTVNAGPPSNDMANASVTPYQMTFESNLVDARSKNVLAFWNKPAGWDWLSSNRNTFATTAPANAFEVPGPNLTLAAWRIAAGADLNSVMATPTYVNGTASIATYSASVYGPTTEDSYVAKLRSRLPGTWTAVNDMQKVFSYYAQQYRPTNLQSPGDGALDFYGASDYRPAAPDLIAAHDTGASSTDNITRTNSNLKFELRNTLTGSKIELLRNGVLVATGTGAAMGVITFVDPAVLTDGVYLYCVRQTGTNGLKITGPSTRVTIDRTPPTAPSVPVLESLVNGKPSFSVEVTDSTLQVQLWRRPMGATSYVLAASRTGSGILRDSGILAAGDYEYVTVLVDLAGNVSAYSTKLKVTIE
jgi:hypothetical protein